MTCTALKSDIASAAPLWNDLLRRRDWSSVFLTPDWQELWWREFGQDGGDLCLITVGPDDAPLGLAPLVSRDGMLTFVGDTDLFDYHDFINVGDGFYEALADCLMEEPWRVMDLASIPQHSPTLTHLPDVLRARGCTVTVETEEVVPGVALPPTWDEFLSTLRRKDRHELRRKLRRLERSADYRIVESSPATLDADMDVFLDLMAESREEKRDFLLPERERFFRRMVERFQQVGSLRLFFMELRAADGQGTEEYERVAAVLAFDHDGRRLLYNSGYRLAYGQLSVGLMLKALVMKDAIERGLTYFDFLRGPEPYKYHLGAQDVTIHRLVATR
ncbi:MAG: GNAT family N-acetyltransferase [Dehalococcoidia bacterium]